MANERRRPFLPGEPPMLSREERALQDVIARAQIRAEAEIEARDAARARALGVRPDQLGFSAFKEATDRVFVREAIERAVVAFVDAELFRCERERQERARRARTLAKARAMLKPVNRRHTR